MSNNKCSSSRERSRQCLLHERFVFRIEVARRFVEHNDGGRLHQHSRNRKTLLFPAGQTMATFADDGVVPIGKSSDHIVDLRCLTGSDNFRIGGAGPGVAEVFGNGVVEKMGILRHNADGTTKRIQREVTDIVTVDPHRTLTDVVETRYERTHCGLPCTGRTDKRNQLTGKNRCRNVMKDLGAGAIID